MGIDSIRESFLLVNDEFQGFIITVTLSNKRIMALYSQLSRAAHEICLLRLHTLIASRDRGDPFEMYTLSSLASSALQL
jgi:hypothetical protein